MLPSGQRDSVASCAEQELKRGRTKHIPGRANATRIAIIVRLLAAGLLNSRSPQSNARLGIYRQLVIAVFITIIKVKRSAHSMCVCVVNGFLNSLLNRRNSFNGLKARRAEQSSLVEQLLKHHHTHKKVVRFSSTLIGSEDVLSL